MIRWGLFTLAMIMGVVIGSVVGALLALLTPVWIGGPVCFVVGVGGVIVGVWVDAR